MNKTIETILIVVLFVLLISVGYTRYNEINITFNKLKIEETQTPKETQNPKETQTPKETQNKEECLNLSLQDSAYCLRDYIKPFYKYNITDDNIDLTLDELKERGGDCRDWAKLYYSLANDLGFYVERPVIQTSEKFAHTFIVMSDETGYCTLDQLNVKCTKFNNEN